jgi:hypothetical protein
MNETILMLINRLQQLSGFHIVCPKEQQIEISTKKSGWPLAFEMFGITFDENGRTYA